MKLNLTVVGDAIEQYTATSSYDYAQGRNVDDLDKGDILLEKTLATAYQKLLLGKPLGQFEQEHLLKALAQLQRNMQDSLSNPTPTPEIDAAVEALKAWPTLTEIEVPGTAPATPAVAQPSLEAEL